VVSLFCGAGGLDYGFHKNDNYEHVLATDFNKNACVTYENNLRFKPICADIKTIKEFPDHDILLFGMPCQSFSYAGKRDLEDPRGQLYLEALRVLKEKKPKYFLCENVKGLLSMGGYASKEDKKKREGITFKTILNDFEEAGYKIKWKLFEMEYYKVPQMRRRVIIAGVRNDIDFEPMFPEPQAVAKTLRDAIGDLPIEQDPSRQHISVKTPASIKRRENKPEACWMGMRTPNWEKPAYTALTTSPPENHPSMERRLTIRELARIQTFPDDFVFYGSITSMIKQIGNAVPPAFSVQLASMFTN
jgi:DNA (cytosine-5)-methyltransferase 1